MAVVPNALCSLPAVRMQGRAKKGLGWAKGGGSFPCPFLGSFMRRALCLRWALVLPWGWRWT